MQSKRDISESEDPNQKTLNEAAAIWLQAGIGPVEEHSVSLGQAFGGGTVAFTWRGEDYEVSLRKL